MARKKKDKNKLIILDSDDEVQSFNDIRDQDPDDPYYELFSSTPSVSSSSTANEEQVHEKYTNESTPSLGSHQQSRNKNCKYQITDPLTLDLSEELGCEKHDMSDIENDNDNEEAMEVMELSSKNSSSSRNLSSSKNSSSSSSSSDEQELLLNDNHKECPPSEKISGVVEPSSLNYDVSKLIPGTLIYAIDINATRDYNAEVIEPGIENDMVHIQFVEGPKRVIPLCNVVSLVSMTGRSKRKRTSRVEKAPTSDNNPSRLKKASTYKKARKGNNNDKANRKQLPTRKKRGRKSSLSSLMTTTTGRGSILENAKVFSEKKVLTYDLPIDVIVKRTSQPQNFLKVMFGKNLKIVEQELGKVVLSHTLDKELIIEGTTYHLLLSKEKSNKLKKHSFENEVCVAYYIGGDDFKTKDDVKDRLEAFGNLGQLALNPGKLCSRLELLVSPSCSEYKGVYCMKVDDFELIDEDQHVGCGFAPPAFFEEYEFSPKIFALQIRIFSAELGWFKGMLMKNPFVDKIQLPSSMLKVQKAVNPCCSSEVHFVVNSTFPCKANISLEKQSREKVFKKTFLKDCRPLNNIFKRLLHYHGISQDDIENYEGFFCGRNGKLEKPRNDCTRLVGVADPTLSLPKDSVFVSGLKSTDCSDKVFVTRYPGLVKDDAKLFSLVNSWKPQGMSDEEWSYLQSLPFGFIVFGKSSESPLSLPEQVADSDLDGDNFHVLWDYKMIKLLKAAEVQNSISPETQNVGMTKTEDEYYDCDIVIRSGKNSFKDATVIGKVDDNSYEVQVGKETRIVPAEEIEGKQLEVLAIVGHHGNDLKVRWRLRNGDIKETMEKKSDMKRQIPNMVAEYAIEKNLLEHPDWRWAKRYVRDTYMKKIIKHEEKNGILNFTVRYDDGSADSLTQNVMQKDAPEMLYPYADEKNILPKWRNEYVKSSSADWFNINQHYSCNLKLLKDQADLKKNFYGLHGKMVEKNDIEAAEHFDKAFKKALELRKHNGNIELPYHLIKHLRKGLQCYVLNIDNDIDD